MKIKYDDYNTQISVSLNTADMQQLLAGETLFAAGIEIAAEESAQYFVEEDVCDERNADSYEHGRQDGMEEC